MVRHDDESGTKAILLLQLGMHHSNNDSLGNIWLQQGSTFVARKGDEMGMPFRVVYSPVCHGLNLWCNVPRVKHLVADATQRTSSLGHPGKHLKQAGPSLYKTERGPVRLNSMKKAPALVPA
jgi:hypothetical protein